MNINEISKCIGEELYIGNEYNVNIDEIKIELKILADNTNIRNKISVDEYVVISDKEKPIYVYVKGNVSDIKTLCKKALSYYSIEKQIYNEKNSKEKEKMKYKKKHSFLGLFK